MLTAAQEGYADGAVAHMPMGPGLDDLFARTDTSGSYAMLPDALGSTVAMVNSAGAISTGYQYSPFGQTTMTGASSTNPFWYGARWCVILGISIQWSAAHLQRDGNRRAMFPTYAVAARSARSAHIL